MATFYVIWRGAEDPSFFFTKVNLPKELLEALDNQQIIQMVCNIEHPNGPNPYFGEDYASYELLEILGGDVTFHMR